jgi:hypothetical protein
MNMAPAHFTHMAPTNWIPWRPAPPRSRLLSLPADILCQIATLCIVEYGAVRRLHDIAALKALHLTCHALRSAVHPVFARFLARQTVLLLPGSVAELDALAPCVRTLVLCAVHFDKWSRPYTFERGRTMNTTGERRSGRIRVGRLTRRSAGSMLFC